jgi:hypothetical protein
MKTVVRRLRRVEDQLGPKVQRDFVRNPRQRLRLVVARMDRPLNLATSRCTRTLSPDGFLMEIVRLNGICTGLGEEELERFVASFPIQMPESQVVQ